VNRHDQAYAALGTVVDPELDEPITELGFVRSLVITGDDVEVHLRLPTSFCAPNFAYLMASDAKDVLVRLVWTEHVVVELDDHHDSDVINAGLATDAGYRGTFRRPKTVWTSSGSPSGARRIPQRWSAA
jgi:metal-sulfur cluster biosynthetic enzyme